MNRRKLLKAAGAAVASTAVAAPAIAQSTPALLASRHIVPQEPRYALRRL
jgi:hypothetical protein